MKNFNNLVQLNSKELLEINGGGLTEVTHSLVSGAGGKISRMFWRYLVSF